MIGYFILGNVLIEVDLFSTRRDAMKPGEVIVLDQHGDIRRQIYEALGGRDFERVDKIMGGETHCGESCGASTR